MRTVKPLKVIWKYLGDASPEKKKEAEENLKQVYDRIFKKAVEDMRANREKNKIGPV